MGSQLLILMSNNTTLNWIYKWYHPIQLSIVTTIFFTIVRLILGGAPFLPSKAWYAFCILLPLFIFAVEFTSAISIPLNFGWQTLFHLILTTCYFQVDIL